MRNFKIYVDTTYMDLMTPTPAPTCHFLHNQRSVLRTLRLRNINLPTLEHWQPIFALLLGEAPGLSDLNCDEPTARPDTTVSFEEYRRWETGSFMCCCGKEEVTAELQRALDYFFRIVS
jgi:hypothetical protein